MSLIHPSTRLADVIIEQPQVLPVLNRFGIRLGVGRDTVAQICENHGLDTRFVLTILNTYLNDEYFPERHLLEFDIVQIVKYLRLTLEYYSTIQVPNIERHFSSLVARSGPHNNLEVFSKMWESVKTDLQAFIDHDLRLWYDHIDALAENRPMSAYRKGFVVRRNGDSVEELLSDLINMLVTELRGDYNANLGYATVVALKDLLVDFRQNHRIRELILKPLYTQLLSRP